MDDASKHAPGGVNLGSANALEPAEIPDGPPRPVDADSVADLQQLRASPDSRTPSDDDESQSDAAMQPATHVSTSSNAPATLPLSGPDSDQEVPLQDQEVECEDLGIAFKAPSGFFSCHYMDDDPETKAILWEAPWFYPRV